MSFLRRQCAARLLPLSLSTNYIARFVPISSTRFESTKAASQINAAPPPKADRSDPPADPASATGAIIRQESPAEGTVDHQPNYHAPVDHGTSNFSAIPRRVMDGSEPSGDLAAAVLSGAPVELQARTVRIYRPAKTATQSGDWHGHHWRMDWDVMGKGHRWENPLMGWQSSADFMQGTHLNFKSKETAIDFANKQGYEYFVQEPNERRIIPKAYANNFLHEPKKLKHIRTK
ncbi:hypothetical protein MMC25_006258 [Agyrium rufum]|nr:hypothetical protein [Agyrium rufum]